MIATNPPATRPKYPFSLAIYQSLFGQCPMTYVIKYILTTTSDILPRLHPSTSSSAIRRATIFWNIERKEHFYQRSEKESCVGCRHKGSRRRRKETQKDVPRSQEDSAIHCAFLSSLRTSTVSASVRICENFQITLFLKTFPQ